MPPIMSVILVHRGALRHLNPASSIAGTVRTGTTARPMIETMTANIAVRLLLKAPLGSNAMP